MAALTLVFLFLLFLSANSDECSKLDSSCFSAIPMSKSAAALFVFGDSTVDADNNNYIHSAPRANFLPYGIDFSNIPTGRFTNGKTIADFIGIILLTTVNCTLPLSDCWSLQTQIEVFNRIIQEDLPCMIEDPQELAEYLANSIFFISMGANNYTSNFNNHHGPEYFANSLLIQFRWYLQTLYNIGARNLVVNNIGPLGCLPSAINKTGNGQCDEQMNENIMPYNSQLPQILKNIQDEYPNATLTLANSYDFLQDILADTEKYGFTDVKDPCCGAYVQGELACIPSYSTPCNNRWQSLFFDASHTSEFANCIFV
ncbi:GDSL esterase/lipase [Camellia lanceoleosa]|uniref:GDSL esterase/lipase n=1 Tax=Camellia lanceoleosa TaxID=1840588 RepID=A0ACC0G2Q8_9ERIC|nr:GDSL esterase/lipase [Camellia lanceoleosa]